MRNVTKMLQMLSLLFVMAFVFATQVNAQSTLLTESWENGGSIPTGWALETVSGTTGAVTFVTSSTSPTVSAAYNGSYFVKFNSYNASTGASVRLKRTTAISTVNFTNVGIDFAWYQDPGFSGNADRVDVQWSTDGTTWNTAGTFNRYNATAGWFIKNVTLPTAANNQATLYVAFTFVSGFGNNCSLDFAHVTAVGPPPPATITIGSGTATCNYPYTTYWQDGRTQLLYTAAQIAAAGGSAGAISSMGFDVSTYSSQTMNGFNIRMMNTTSTSLSNFVSGLTTVYTGTYAVPGAGWQMITLQNPFIWDGTSNLLVEVCYDNTSYTSYSPVRGTAASGKAIYYYTDGAAGCSFTSANTGANLPNFRFVEQPYVGTLTGTILNCFNNQPLAGATVTAGTLNATTNASGNFTIYNVPIGDYNVQISAPTFVTKTVAATISNQQTTTIATCLDPIPGVLTGVVTNASNGNPVIGAAISVANPPYNTTTYSVAGGAYTLNVFPGGNFTVTASKAGFDNLSVGPLTFTQGVTNNQNFALQENANAPVDVVAELNTAQTAVNINWGLPVGNYQLTYDDGIAENFTVWTLAGNQNAVKFTPVGYPATVYAGMINIGTIDDYPAGSSPLVPFDVDIYDASGPGGTPGTSLGTTTVTPGGFGWVSFNLSAPVTITSGSFYMVMTQGGNAPDAAGIAVDETNPQLRSYARFVTGSGPWVPAGGNFMMRAIVNGAGGPLLTDATSAPITTGTVSGANYQHPLATITGVEGAGQVVPVPGDNGDVITGYQVWRLKQGEEATPALWISIGTPATTTIVDNGWPSLACGPYRWAVEAIYTGNRFSGPAFSNVIGKCWTAQVTVNVGLTCAAHPLDGSIVELKNNAYPDTIYTATTNTTGTAVFPTVWKGNYTLKVTRFSYPVYTQVIDIMGDVTVDVMLLQDKTAPSNLYVDDRSLVATWNAPRASVQVLAETWASGNFTANQWVTAGGSNWSVSSGIGNPAPSAMFNWSPQVTNYTQTLTSKQLTGVHAPVQLLKYDIYLDNFGTTNENQMAVEAWDGTTWTTLKNYTNLNGSMNWTSESVDITAYTHINFKIRFRAYGADSYDINNWNVDNIYVVATDGTTGANPCVLGYNFYLNGIQDAFTTDTVYNIPRTHVTYGQTYNACVNAVYGSGYSADNCYTFTSHYLFPPRNLQVEAVECSAYLTWEQPMVEDGAALDQSYMPATSTQPAADLAQGDGVSGLPTVSTSLSNFSDAVLFDNGPLVNSPGTGAGGADESILQSGLGTYGFGAQQTAGNSVADDFTIASGTWNPTAFTFFSYQTGSSTTSTFTGCYFRIWSGAPNAGGTVVWGDMTTNRLSTSTFSNIYRNNNGPGGATDRPIMKLICNVTGLSLPAGTYWVEWQATGTLGSGPWAPPITIQGQLTTGNALQNQSGTWINLVDGSYAQGIPFIIEGPGGSGGAPQGLIGYNIYRDGDFIHFVNSPDTLYYYDFNLDPDDYVYEITAKYDLTDYGFPGQFDESLTEGPANVSIECGRPLPFYEPWDQGSFAFNDWTAPTAGNWTVATGFGNPAPAADFGWQPIITDYDQSLTSPVINAGPWNCAAIWLDFDYKLEDRNATGDEMLTVELFYNGSWHEKAEFANEGSVDWTPKHIDISAVRGKAFMIRFRAHGANSADILHWYVDNIHAYGVCNTPTELSAEQTDLNQVTLTWTAPECTSAPSGQVMEFIYDDGTWENGFCINPGYLAWFGNQFPLAPTMNGVIQKFKIYMVDNGSGSAQTMTIDVFDASQTLVASSAPFTAAPYDQWIEIPVSDIPFTGMFYAMLKWDNTPAQSYFLATDDDGPYSASDLAYYYDGTTWSTASSVMGTGPTVFLMRATALVYSDLKTVELVPAAKPANNGTTTLPAAAFSMSNTTGDTHNHEVMGVVSSPADSSQIMGYNVYRSDAPGQPFNKLNSSPWTSTTYVDNGVASLATLEYFVTAVYNDSQANAFLCESPGSDTVSIYVGVNELTKEALQVYPNPAKEFVNVRCEANINTIEVMNFIGQTVITMNNLDAKATKINVTSLPTGVYFVKVTTEQGVRTVKITVTR